MKRKFPNRRSFFFLFVFLNSVFFFAQTTLRGKIIDEATGQTLPFVSLLIKNSQKGTLSDIDGKFNFTLPADAQGVVLQVSYISYHPVEIKLSSIRENENMIIRLKPKEINLNEIIVVGKENPAHRIIKRATKMRDKNNPEKMHSFQYNSYNKCFVTADLKANIDSVSASDTSLSSIEKFFRKQHLFLLESVTERKFLKPNNNHETVLASRVSGFKNSPFALLATQLQSFSFYDDFISVLDEKYLNPISEGSTKKYSFAIEDTLYDGKDTVFVIAFRPRKNKNFNGMKGALYINTNGYAIQNVIAEPDRIDDYLLSIKIQQKYEFIDSAQWFPVQLNTDWIWKNATVTSKSDTSQRTNLKAVSRSYIGDVVLNPELKKKIFNEVEVEVDKHADKQSEEYWNKYRADSINTKDKATYHMIDSVGKAENLEKKFLALEALFTNAIPIGKLDLRLDKILRVNDYEACRLGAGLKTNQKFSNYFSVGAYAGYGFGDKAWKYGADASVFLWKKKEWTFNSLYENDLVESGGAQFFENIRTLNSSELYRDAYVSVFDHIQKYQSSFSFRMLKYIRANVYANHQQRYGVTQYGYTSNDGVTTLRDTFQFNEAGVQLKFLYKEKFLQTTRSKISLGSDYPVLFVNIAKGMDQTFFNQRGDFDYWKLDVKFEANKVFKTIGRTNLLFQGGAVIGDLPYTMLYNNRGSLYGKFNVSCSSTFETMGLNEFASSRYAALFINHNIGRFLKLRKKFNPELELAHNMGVGTIDNAQRIYNISVTSMEKGYFESGIRVLHLLRYSVATYGIGIFYRYGPYQKPDPKDNVAVKLVVAIKM